MIDVHAGTREATWAAWPALEELPPLPLPASPGEVVVVAPHPDDEVLGAGGLLRVLGTHGHTVRVVAVTDGEASHPGSTAVLPDRLAMLRAEESRRALVRLGLRTCRIERLRVPDGRVAEHEDAIAAALEPLVADAGLVLAPWRADGHPDHDAAGRAAVRAAEGAGRPLLEFPVWMWNWAAPDDPRVPWARAWRIALPAGTQAAKRAAIAEFRSQTEPLGPAPADGPVLPAPVLRHHRRAFEVVFG